MTDYSKFGRVPEWFELERMQVTPVTMVREPTLVLKVYRMLPEHGTSYIDIFERQAYRDFLKREIKEGNIEPYLGLGFAIFSEDIVNVAMWDSTYPIVLQNQLYRYENGNISTAKPLDIREDGSFCVHELGIVNHERNAWVEYLRSPKAEKDVKRYLSNVVEGPL